MSSNRSARWTFAITSLALFMVVLDNLVVTMVLPSIHQDLGGGVADLEWTVNAYTLTFAVLLLAGAALGERFGDDACSRPGWPSSPPARQQPPWRRALSS